MTDEKIIELYLARAEAAIEETDRAYGRYFRSVAYGILWDEEDAEETVNDAYLKAWNIIPPERPNYLKAFLARITRQLSINRLEQNTAQKRGAGQYALILDELAENPLKGSPEVILSKLASMACKAAVKGNSKMSTEEAHSLMDELLTLENPYHCPHGRPTMISMSKYEIEKKFKRIV